jgi:hypothetical protein
MSFSVVVFVIFCFLFVDSTLSVYIKMRSGEKKCFLEDIPKDTLVAIEWAIDSDEARRSLPFLISLSTAIAPYSLFYFSQLLFSVSN